ncbi:MAG: NAD-dependent deacylase [Brumimicrobium sp.]|nr:NAD-dependent deacylase [Brumimicrobium sp.]
MTKKKIVVLSGAGISAESGLGTFRDSGGLWEKYPIEQVATPEAWEKDSALVTEFYNMRRKQAYEASPNAGHLALAKLEKNYDVSIITQNIDDLHERAGSSNVIHLHGEISKVKSSGPSSEKKYYLQKNWEVKMGDLCPEGYQLRPHVVWFGEEVPMLGKAAEVVRGADIFIVVGTSLNVYPAAGLVDYVRSEALCYLVDPSEVSVPKNFRIIQKNASTGLPMLANELKE